MSAYSDAICITVSRSIQYDVVIGEHCIITAKTMHIHMENGMAVLFLFRMIGNDSSWFVCSINHKYCAIKFVNYTTPCFVTNRKQST